MDTLILSACIWVQCSKDFFLKTPFFYKPQTGSCFSVARISLQQPNLNEEKSENSSETENR